MRSIIIAAVFGIVPMAFGQESRPPNWEYRHLYNRIVRSAIVVQGKAVERKPVWKREVPSVVRDGPTGYRTANIGDIKGGDLFIVEISQSLCRQQDFIPGTVQEQQLPTRMNVFVSDTQFGFHTTNEQLFKGREYLLFLSPYPQQQDLHEKFELDSDAPYYRVDSGYLGARERADPEHRGTKADTTTPVIAAVTALCEAMKPADVKAKLARLRELQSRADPRWRDSVDAAIRAFEAHESARPQ